MKSVHPSLGFLVSIAVLLKVQGATTTWGQEVRSTPVPPSVASPLSPEESLKHLVLADPNLQIEIAAAEPEVIDPVAIQFDEHGRLWVVEMRDYPTGPKEVPPPLGGPDAKPLSRIKLLEDKDGDGRYETAHVFADNLLFATGVQPWDGGVIVTLTGEVAYFKDTDGDHKADVRETWFTGFSQQNTQLRANHPTFGPDGWIYVANGLRGGNVIAVKKDWPVKAGAEGRGQRGEGEDKKKDSDSGPRPSALSPQPTPISLTGRDFKFDPLTGRYEAISGNGQFGMTFDAWGNRFVCDNRHPCRHVIFEEDFIKRCPHVAFPAVVHDVIPPDDKNQVFPLTSAWTTSNLHAGTFTASCGVTVYTGDWLPEEFRGNVFVCEPTGNLVQRAVLESDGVTFKSRNPHAPNETTNTNATRRAGGVSPRTESNSTGNSNAVRGLTPPARQEIHGEFLASRDDWFRPVDLQNGPDGALYVVDMYRAVIEHPEWVPDELKNRPDTWLGNDKGRIYRIRPKGPRRKADFSVLATKQGYNHKNNWTSMTSLRLLVEKRPLHGPIDYYQAISGTVAYDIGNMRHMFTDTLGYIDRFGEAPLWDRWSELNLAKELRHSNPQVRKGAVQMWSLVMPLGSVSLCEDIARAALQDANDPWMRQTVVGVTGDAAPVVLNELFQLTATKPKWDEPGFRELVSRLCEQIGSRGSDTDINWTIIKIGDAVRSSTVSDQLSRQEFGLNALLSLGNGLARRGRSLASSNGLTDLSRRNLQLVERPCYSLAVDEKASPELRRLAIRWLKFAGHANNPGWVAGHLRKFVEQTADQSLKLLAIESLSSSGFKENDVWLLKRYAVETPAIRRAILAALMASKERQLALLGAIADGRVAATEIDPVRAKQLMESKDEAVREKAKQVLAAAAPASRKEVLEAYQSALTLKGDPQRGREVFQKNCVTCHRVGDLGVNVAPDISDTRTKKPEQLLLDILDPNRAIDANYFAYAVVTKDGKTESGVIASESSNSITLKQPEGKTLTLLRSDIDELRNTGLSLMPVGVEKNINPQQMADLIFWLKNWRYLDGKVPATSVLAK